MINDSIELNYEDDSERLKALAKNVEHVKDLSKVITKFIKGASREVVLLIDEVDKSSNNQLFLSFLGMLRNKYLAREQEEDYTFKSVILVGMHDVKSLKLRLRPEEEAKYNSPWNIAVNFNVDMSFSPEEISTMLSEYFKNENISMDIKEISEELYFFTSGYPFLVSRLCQIIDENISKDKKNCWNIVDVKRAVEIINEEVNTLFESIVKNLENNKELYELTKKVLIYGENINNKYRINLWYIQKR